MCSIPAGTSQWQHLIRILIGRTPTFNMKPFAQIQIFFYAFMAAHCFAGPATAPTSAPITFGSGPVSIVQTTYHAGMAPAVAFYDARNLPADFEFIKLEWVFGDKADLRPDPRHHLDAKDYPATVDANVGLQGPIAAHDFEQPGTYVQMLKGTPDVGGAIATWSLKTFVDPDTRTQINIGPGQDAQFSKAAGQSNVHIHVVAGTHIRVTDTIHYQSTTVIEGMASPDGSQPLITFPAGIICFAGSEDSHDFTIRNLDVDSEWKPAKTKSGYPYADCTAVLNGNAQASEFIKIRGRNIAVLRCRFYHVNRFAETPDTTAHGVLLDGNRQMVVNGVAQQCASFWGGSSEVVQFNDFTCSVNESTVRLASANVDGFSLQFNHIAQQDDGDGSSKAVFTNRAAKDHFEYANAIEDGEISFNHGVGSANSCTVTHGLAKFNLLVASHAPVAFRVEDATDDLTIRDNRILTRNYAAFKIDHRGSWIKNVRIRHNTWSGPNSRAIDYQGGDTSGITFFSN